MSSHLLWRQAAATQSTPRTSSTLVADVVQSRLKFAALLYSIIYLFAYGIGFVLRAARWGLYPERIPPEDIPPWIDADTMARALDGALVGDIAAAVSMLTGVAISIVVWRRPLRASALLDTALIFGVAASLGISVAELWGPRPPFNTGISWVAFWLPVYVLIVPLPPRRTAVAVLLSACTQPLVYHVHAAMIGHWDGAEYQLSRFVPVFIAAGAAYVASRHIYRLSSDAARARQMGSYRLVEKIGAGGMGEVWRAEHQLLARPAAVKLIRREVLGGDLDLADNTVRRFEREARATAALDSPHTVELYDFGIAEDGTFFYVMELLRGIDLETLVARFGPQQAERTAFLLRQACHSLEDAHRAGLLHRDIKPANLFTCRKGYLHDYVKVLDFGLVKAIDENEAALKLTAEGSTSGTPAYMAPETARSSAAAEPRSDIYALGCVGYWLLTGTLLFDARTPIEMLLAHVEKQPEPPSMRTEMPIEPTFEALILQCLAKNPADRPRSALELARAIEACPFERRWTEQRAEKWWRTHLPEY